MTDIDVETTQDETLYGLQTELAVRNFAGEERKLRDVPQLVRSYAYVKSAAAWANGELEVLTAPQVRAIQAACAEMAEGLLDDAFPSALVLGGGGTSTNMNVNEVIARRATQIGGIPLHPNDHINASQSTNDTYPTAMALAVHELINTPVRELHLLAEAFETKAKEFNDTVRLGRTCLQDAVTLTVGQTHRAHALSIRKAARVLNAAAEGLLNVPLGATVLGTGVGAPDGYQALALQELARLTGHPVKASEDLFESLSNLDPYAEVAGSGARVAIAMAKISADLRFLSSGPVGGIAEVTLPTVQAGSSIMPGKVNPAIPEYVMQLSYRVRGNAHTVEAAVAAGELELNIMEPVIVDALTRILQDLSNSAHAFTELCVRGLVWDGDRLNSNAQGDFGRWVALAAEEGYDVATRAVRASRGGANHD
ncbi:lyase family protein [Rothia sp. AR01]|uniref:Lyase family protein n=1 Tax=Rothia santali TaxID=2949643 RepID=A0A9X2HI57_9MICC|nr:lyase family protein [Rothia santali]MCP3424708.1 lyase family protein [Rothia santali]